MMDRKEGGCFLLVFKKLWLYLVYPEDELHYYFFLFCFVCAKCLHTVLHNKWDRRIIQALR